MTRKKSLMTIQISKEELRKKPRLGVKASRTHKSAKTYQRKPKHPKKSD